MQYLLVSSFLLGVLASCGSESPQIGSSPSVVAGLEDTSASVDARDPIFHKLDLGSAVQGAEMPFDVVLGELHGRRLEQLRPSCGCTSAEISYARTGKGRFVVKEGDSLPEESLSLHGTLSTVLKVGSFRETIVLTFHSGEPVTIELNGQIIPSLSSRPPDYHFGFLKEGSREVEKFAIASEVFQRTELEVVPFGDTFGVFSAELRRSAESDWILKVTADVRAIDSTPRAAKTGFRIFGKGYSPHPGFEVPSESWAIQTHIYVEAEVVPDIFFKQSSVSFGLLESSQPRHSKSVSLAGFEGEVMGIESVELTSSTGTVTPRIEFEAQRDEGSDKILLFSLILPESSSGVIRGTATLGLAGVNDVLDLPFFGVVKGSDQ